MDDLKARAEAVIKALKQLSSAHAQAPDVTASTAAEAIAVIQELLGND
jgi:hypothetical protein